ncbi:glycosyltransferase family 2 protein [Sphingobacterium hungaricum]|uniref:Glycosyl transferase n=1 Tax=Sphingobacterium hungaricum TaxID=2082723 RepID=A0A928YRP9_9SPHI|nr:glycosyltransferase [Sphingobacterium hungaricum]MBE8713533.1 glycosyl transferase [Sphingobacterium hungaricum]
MTLVYVILVLYMRKGWSSIPSFSSSATVRTKVSVLIAARNEEENIARTLDCVLNQDFPKELLEIIVVDDHSTDSTASIIASYAPQGVKLIKLNEGDKLNSYKKLAISRAIELAQGEIIVTTDADCRMGKNWLKTVVSYFEKNDNYLVSSPVIYDEEINFFERLQTLEFLYLIGLGAAGIGNGNPTTCNGANLAYRRDIFYEMGGFKNIDNLASGDDELFLHKVAAQYASKIGFCKSKEAVVYTDAKPNLKSFINQRKRWASKSTKYKDKKVVALGICIWGFNLALLIGLVLFFSLLPGIYWPIIFAIVLKIAVEFLFIKPLCNFANRKELLLYLPALSIAHSFYLVYIGIAGNIGKYDWKDRKVN